MSYHKAGKGPCDWKMLFVPSLTKCSWGQVHFMSDINKYVGLVQVGNSGSDKGIATLYLIAFKKYMAYVLSYWKGIYQYYVYCVYCAAAHIVMFKSRLVCLKWNQYCNCRWSQSLPFGSSWRMKAIDTGLMANFLKQSRCGSSYPLTCICTCYTENTQA